MTISGTTKRHAARLVSSILRPVLPLSVRKKLILWLDARKLPGLYRFAFLLLDDFARQDPSGFHAFLWSHHLGHAESYEIVRRYGEAKLDPTRAILLREVCRDLQNRGIDCRTDVRSVFDVGCSVGHVLQHVESQIFPSATILEGIDIDEYAIRAGAAHIARIGSKAQIRCANLESLETTMDGKIYDVILCFGVLLYVDRGTATLAVKTMLQHSRLLVALSTWPHPLVDNAELTDSVHAGDLVRNGPDLMDGTLIHNLDEMVKAAGGRIVSRGWTGKEVVQEDRPLYFVLAQPV